MNTVINTPTNTTVINVVVKEKDLKLRMEDHRVIYIKDAAHRVVARGVVLKDGVHPFLNDEWELKNAFSPVNDKIFYRVARKPSYTFDQIKWSGGMGCYYLKE